MKRKHPIATAMSMATLVIASAMPLTTYARDDDAMTKEVREQRAEIQDTLAAAAETLETMKQDPDLFGTLAQAKGLFLVPKFGRASLGVGASGGEGVLVVRKGGDWSTPMFYNMGNINIGLEAGVEGGEIAMLIMSDQGLEDFLQENEFSLNADAGLTFLDWSARGQASSVEGDIVMWSDTAGLYGDLAVNVRGIVWDDDENRQFYGKDLSPKAIAQGNKSHHQGSNPLKDLLP